MQQGEGGACEKVVVNQNWNYVIKIVKFGIRVMCDDCWPTFG